MTNRGLVMPAMSVMTKMANDDQMDGRRSFMYDEPRRSNRRGDSIYDVDVCMRVSVLRLSVCEPHVSAAFVLSRRCSCCPVKDLT